MPVIDSGAPLIFRMRGGSRFVMPVVDASSGGRALVFRVGSRIVMPVASSTPIQFVMRAGSRWRMPVVPVTGIIPRTEPPRPTPQFARRSQAGSGGSATGQVACGGSVRGQAGSGGSTAGQVNNG